MIGDIREDMEKCLVLVKAARSKECEMWRRAMRCTLSLADAERVEREMEHIRNTSLMGLPVVGCTAEVEA